MRRNKVTNKTLYEIHGSCNFRNVDVTNWVLNEDKVQCRIGIYYEKSTIDWLTINAKYSPSEQDKANIFNCSDGFSDFSMINMI